MLADCVNNSLVAEWQRVLGHWRALLRQFPWCFLPYFFEDRHGNESLTRRLGSASIRVSDAVIGQSRAFVTLYKENSRVSILVRAIHVFRQLWLQTNQFGLWEGVGVEGGRETQTLLSAQRHCWIHHFRVDLLALQIHEQRCHLGRARRVDDPLRQWSGDPPRDGASSAYRWVNDAARWPWWYMKLRIRVCLMTSSRGRFGMEEFAGWMPRCQVVVNSLDERAGICAWPAHEAPAARADWNWEMRLKSKMMTLISSAAAPPSRSNEAANGNVASSWAPPNTFEGKRPLLRSVSGSECAPASGFFMRLWWPAPSRHWRRRHRSSASRRMGDASVLRNGATGAASWPGSSRKDFEKWYSKMKYVMEPLASENQLTSQVEAFSWENDGTWEIRVAGASSPVS